jgi:hypothetical protein
MEQLSKQQIFNKIEYIFFLMALIIPTEHLDTTFQTQE